MMTLEAAKLKGLFDSSFVLTDWGAICFTLVYKRVPALCLFKISDFTDLSRFNWLILGDILSDLMTFFFKDG
jgi:hypothetical protein